MSYSLHTKALCIDQERLHRDLLKKLNKLDLSQSQPGERLKISRATIHRLSKNKPITIDTYLKAILWLDKPANNYIKEER